MAKKKVSNRKRISGSGFFDDVVSGFKSVFNPVNDFLKQSKIISTVGSLIPDARAKAVSGIAGSLGYGRSIIGAGRIKSKNSRGQSMIVLT